MDLKGFVVKSQGEDHVVLHHPEHGHEVKIMHKNTSQQHKGEMKYADGGKVKSEHQPEPKPINPDVSFGFNNAVGQPGIKQAADNGKKVMGYADGTPDGPIPDSDSGFLSTIRHGLGYLTGGAIGDAFPTPQAPADSAPQAAPQPPSNPQLPQAPQNSLQSNLALAGTDEMGKVEEAGLANQISGTRKEAQAQGQLGQDQSKVLGQGITDLSAIQSHFKEQFDKLDKDRGELINDIAARHIHPEHYIGDMSTVGKVSTGIGLLLGGLGAGLTGGPNQALEFLNKQIDRDIDAQKAKLGTKETLLSANLKQFGNLHDAMTMTRINQMDILSNQLQQAAAKSQDPMAKARAQAAIGELQQKAAPLLSQIAGRQALLNASKQGAVPPSTVISLTVPEHEQQKVSESLGKVQELNGLQKMYQESFQDIHSKFANGLFSPSDTSSAKNILAGKLSHATAGRYNQQEAEKLIDSILPAKTDLSEATVQKKLMRGKELFDSMKAEHQANLDRFGINVPAPVVPKKLMQVPQGYKK